jgi:excisionase family DNA binding protein
MFRACNLDRPLSDQKDGPRRAALLPQPEFSMAAEPWVSVDDVAKHLGVVKDSIYRWIEARGLPAHKVGRLWKFKLSEVDVWVRRRGADPEVRRDSGKEDRVP